MSADSIEKIADELEQYCETSDDCCYGTLSTALVRGYTQRLRALPSAELERDAARMRWLQRMAAYVGFSADPWLVDPTRIDVAIEDENRPARASEAAR